MSYFTIRECCPVCKSKNSNMLYAFKFTDSQIKGFLRYFYDPHGGVEFEYLEKAQFILDECRDCGLINQRQIPGDFLMNKLYKE